MPPVAAKTSRSEDNIPEAIEITVARTKPFALGSRLLMKARDKLERERARVAIGNCIDASTTFSLDFREGANKNYLVLCRLFDTAYFTSVG